MRKPGSSGAAGSTAVPASSFDPAARRLIFADEFNGTALYTSAWAPYNSRGNAGYGLRRPSAFTLEEGNLVVTAKIVDYVRVYQ